MTPTSYVFGIVSAVLVLLVVVELLRRHRLRERHAIWWLIAGSLALVVGIFPNLLTSAAAVVGIEVPINLTFFVSIGVLFLVCLQHSAELTRLESKTRTLAERSALQEVKLRALNEKFDDLSSSVGVPPHAVTSIDASIDRSPRR